MLHEIRYKQIRAVKTHAWYLNNLSWSIHKHEITELNMEWNTPPFIGTNYITI